MESYIDNVYKILKKLNYYKKLRNVALSIHDILSDLPIFCVLRTCSPIL